MNFDESGSAGRMVQVRADFRADLVALAKGEFSAIWGTAVQQISDGEILMRYRDALRRRPALRPTQAERYAGD